jgi:hypothetical protein
MLKRGSKPGKPTRCTKCGRPRRGHDGPCGVRCTMIIDNVSEGEWQDDSEPIRSDSPSVVLDTQSPFVRELARQMSELTCNVSRILATQSPGTSTTGLRRQNTSEGLQRRPQASDATPSETGSRKGCTAACCPAGTNDAPVALTNGARVTRKTIINAKAGEYCNLIDFMPTSEPSNILETSIDENTGQLTFKSKTVKKSIDNFLMWTLAWSGYEELLLESDFSRYKTCVAYRLFIQKQNAVYNWSSVEQYDVRFRHNLSMTQSLEFHKTDTDLGFSIFNTTSLRPNPQGCFRCKSLLHHVRDCPFPEVNPVEKAPKDQKSNYRGSRQNAYPYSNGNSGQGNQSRYGSNFARSREVCYNFNSGRCNDPSFCGRLHICSGCGGPDPLPRCRKCSGSSSNNGPHPPQASTMGTPHGGAPR